MSGFFDVYMEQEGDGQDDDAMALRSILSWEGNDDDDDDDDDDEEDEDDADRNAKTSVDDDGAGGTTNAAGRGALGATVTGACLGRATIGGRSDVMGSRSSAAAIVLGRGRSSGLTSEATSITGAVNGSAAGSDGSLGGVSSTGSSGVGGLGSGEAMGSIGPASAALRQLTAHSSKRENAVASRPGRVDKSCSSQRGGGHSSEKSMSSDGGSTAATTEAAVGAGEDDSMNSFLAQLQSEYAGTLAQGKGSSAQGGVGGGMGTNVVGNSSICSLVGLTGLGNWDSSALGIGPSASGQGHGQGSASMNNLLAGMPSLPRVLNQLPSSQMPPKAHATKEEGAKRSHKASDAPVINFSTSSEDRGRKTSKKRKVTGGEKAGCVGGKRKAAKKQAGSQNAELKKGNGTSTSSIPLPLGPVAALPAMLSAGSSQQSPLPQQQQQQQQQQPSSRQQVPMVPLSLPRSALPSFPPFGGVVRPDQLQHQQTTLAAIAAAQFGNFADPSAVLQQLQALQQIPQQSQQHPNQGQQPSPSLLSQNHPLRQRNQLQEQRKEQKDEKMKQKQDQVPTLSPLRSVTRINPETVIAPNVVSCSDTDGLTTDAESATIRNPGSRADVEHSFSSILPKGPIDANDANSVVDGDEFRANAARERNREHARNTRLRKKAYLDKLKITVEELCRERDILISERAGAANLLVEMHNTRTDVLLSFFALRSANERRRELWSSILDESCFSCLLPVTPYRSFPASEVQVARCQRTVLGIDGMMADTASLHVLLNSLVDRSRFPDAKVNFRHSLVTEDAVVAGNQMMARWDMTTLNAVECGASMEVSKRGMLCCKFNSAHKITGLELMFDVMAFMLQLKQAAGTDSFAVVPNTVQTCQRPFDMPMVMTTAERPYTIVQVNRLWEEMTGWKAEDVVGRTSCRVLQGRGTEASRLEDLMVDICYKRPATVALTNYAKSGKQFRNHLNVYPLSTDSKITHYVALTTYAGWKVGSSNSKDGPSLVDVQDPKKTISGSDSNQTSKRYVVDSESVKTHQAVAPARNSSSLSSTPVSQQLPRKPDQRGQPKAVVVGGSTDRQESSANGGDTISSLTSSLSSSNSDDGANSNGPSLEPTTSAQTVEERQLQSNASRKTVTSQSSSSSAGGSTSTNESFDDNSCIVPIKRGNRKRKSVAIMEGAKEN